MSDDTPKIILLGKSKSEKSDMQAMLQNMETNQIPVSLLDGVYVTLTDKERYRVDNKHMPKDNFDYDSLERFLAGVQFPADIVNVEIVIDLDAAEIMLKEEASALLEPLFDERCG